MLELMTFSLSINVDVVVPISGAYGLFTGGADATTSLASTERLRYSDEVFLTGHTLMVDRNLQAAVGTSSKALTLGGASTSSGNLASSEVYNYADNSVRAGAQSLTVARYGGVGVNNNTYGVVAGGSVGSTVASDRITISTEVVAAGSALSTSRLYTAGNSNTTYGWITSGRSGSTYLNSADRYTFSSNTVVAGTVITGARAQASASGNSTVGIVTGGVYVSGGSTTILRTTNRRTYSGDTVAAGTQFATTHNGNRIATGNSTYGWHANGSNNYRYTYSTDVWTASGAFKKARATGSATSSAPGHL